MKFFSLIPSFYQDEHRSAKAFGKPRGRGAAGLKGSESRRRLVAGVLVALVLGLAGPVFADPPTVNGLFYGDGDDAKYQLYATSVGGSGLYIYLRYSEPPVVCCTGRQPRRQRSSAAG